MLSLLRSCVAALFPPRCAACRTRGSFLCAQCTRAIPFVRYPSCPRCNTLTVKGEFCPSCRKHSALSGVLVMARYETPVKEAVWRFKYSGQRELGAVLGELLGVYVKPFLKSRALVTPVPLHQRRERERGFNQAELLARAVAAAHGLRYEAALVRERHVRPQAGLTFRNRVNNVQGIFGLRKGFSSDGAVVFLVDDVATTTATLNECASLLRNAGAREVWGLVLARS